MVHCYICLLYTSIEEGLKSTKEDSQNLKEDLNSKIEEASRSTNQKIEEGQRENQKHMELLKEELNNQINETNRRMEDGQKKTSV